MSSCDLDFCFPSRLEFFEGVMEVGVTAENLGLAGGISVGTGVVKDAEQQVLQKPRKKMKERENHWRERGCLDHTTTRKGTSISQRRRKWELISGDDRKGATQSRDGGEWADQSRDDEG
ncbi:hypothetical protein L484_006616 [Morus notabilis]|uniref:Uncharacterized protein n=1 Tax=Morus notabilis TaxID=981085 RepID=W9S5X2_9ROSA|nr:hypothetical protein L484_006616 [Morus notabilis]